MLFSWEGSRAKKVSSSSFEFPLKILRKVLLQILKGLSRWCSGKESVCQCKKRYRFSPWVEKIPWSRKWQPTPVVFVLFFWIIPWTEESGRIQSIGSKRVRHDSAERDRHILKCHKKETHNCTEANLLSSFSIPQSISLCPLLCLLRQKSHCRSKTAEFTEVTFCRSKTAVISSSRKVQDNNSLLPGPVLA